MTKNELHVVHNSSRGGWDLKRSGTRQVSIHTETKADAVKVGRVICQRAGSELVIHGVNERIPQKGSHGHVSIPSKDKN